MPQLQRLATRETRFDVMPPFELVAFVRFPAKQNHAALAHRGEIYQAIGVILYLHAETFQLAGAQREIDQQPRVLGTPLHAATTVLGSIRGELCRVLERTQTAMRSLNGLYDWPHAREQGVGFF